MTLSPQEKQIRDKKDAAVNDKLDARKALRARVIDNHTTLLATLDAEIAELELLTKVLKDAK